MAVRPSALACHASSPSRRDLPFDWTAKSMIVVVPPNAAARVPVSKVSEAAVPPNGSSMCVCASMPPGTTSFPVASMTCSSGMSGARPGANSAMIFSPSTRTSAGWAPLAVTTVPPVISMGCSLSLGERAVRVGPAVAVERPAVAHGGDEVHVGGAHDQLGVVGVADVADELPLRVDEVRRAVEVVVAQV